MKSLAVMLVLFSASGAAAAPSVVDYVHDAITVATPGRTFDVGPTATCVVWENAEGVGIGPAQLDGMHGLSMSINVKPLPNDSGVFTSFEAGLRSLKANAPHAPGWMFAALERNRAAIEKRCGEEHGEPFVISKITRKDVAK